MGQCGLSLPVRVFVENLIHPVAKPGPMKIKTVESPAQNPAQFTEPSRLNRYKAKPDTNPVATDYQDAAKPQESFR